MTGTNISIPRSMPMQPAGESLQDEYCFAHEPPAKPPNVLLQSPVIHVPAPPPEDEEVDGSAAGSAASPSSTVQTPCCPSTILVLDPPWPNDASAAQQAVAASRHPTLLLHAVLS
jgi:hypothetical protein